MGRRMTLKILQMKLHPALTVRLGTAGFAVRISVTGSYVVRNVCRVLVGKPEGKRPVGRPRGRWKDNIKMDLQEVGCGVWTGSSWHRIGTGGGRL